MFKAAMLAACLSSAAALTPPQAPRRTSAREAKKRDYSAGGLGSSKQEQFARLWRDKDAPVEPPVARGVPIDARPTRETPTTQVKDETTWEAEIAAFDAAAELVPDAHWRDKGRAAAVEDVSRKAITNERSVAVAAWAGLRGGDSGPYAADDAWIDVDGQARSLVLVVGSVDGVDAASRALHDRLPRKVGRVVAVFPTAAQASKRRKRIGSKVQVLHDEAGTFAAACGVDVASSGVIVLAPPHPSPDQHTIVARFPASLDGVAGAVESALRDKGVLPAVRRTG